MTAADAREAAERLAACVRNDTRVHDNADLLALLDEREQLLAIIAEGNQRDRALALLLLRNGGQVEFTEAETRTAPWHGHLVSHANLATGGLVLAYSADGVTIGIAPAPVPCVYFDQPGHTADQKPALAAYDRGPDDWPLCPACQAIVDEHDAELDANAVALNDDDVDAVTHRTERT